MDYYTVALFLSTFAMLIIQVCVDKSNILTNKRKRLFKSLFNVIIVCSICEWCGWYLQGVDSKARLFHILVKTTELSLAPGIGYLVAWIVEKKDEKLVFGVLIINCILEVASAFFGFIFYVDVNGVYYHADFYWIYIVMYLFSLCYILSYFLLNLFYLFFFFICVFFLHNILIKRVLFRTLIFFQLSMSKIHFLSRGYLNKRLCNL